MMKNEKYISTLPSIEEEVEISTSSFDALVEFACELYDHKENSTDYVRYKLYTLTHGRLEAKAIPPCTLLHTSRANYQAYIWRNCLQQHLQILPPDSYDWNQDGDGVISIKWKTVQPAPNEILELMICTCNRKCTVGSCPFIDSSLMCTDACSKQDCDNMMVAEEAIEIDEVTRTMNNGVLSSC